MVFHYFLNNYQLANITLFLNYHFHIKMSHEGDYIQNYLLYYKYLQILNLIKLIL